MPALRLAGHKWRVSSDFVPIFACVSLVFHVIWCVFIIVWPFGITKVHKCNNTKPGRQFLASVWLFFILYVTSAVQEILIIIIGLRGTPLETRKRKAMIPVLYTQTANWIAQIGAVAYGTYVEHRYQGSMVTTDCSEDSVIMLKVLVFSSWVMISFNWLRLLVVYNLFPDYENIDSWAKRIRLYTWYSRNKSVVSHLQKHQHRPLGRLAELYSRLLHGADLSPSDEFISLILLSAAQRKTRQEHIRKAIDAHRKQQQAQHRQPQLQENLHSCGRADPPPPSHGAAQRQHHSEGDFYGQVNDSAYVSDDSSGRGKSGSLQSISPDKPESDGGSPQQAVDETLSAIQTPNAADDCDLLGKHSQGQKGDQTLHQTGSGTHQRTCDHANDHVVDVGRQNSTPGTSSQDQQPQEQAMSEPQEDAALRMMRHLKAMEEGKGMGASQQGHPQAQGHHPQDQGHQRIARGSLSEPVGHRELSFTERKSSRQHLNQDHFFHRDFMLAPSAFASEYDPDTAPDELADIYTAMHRSAPSSSQSVAAGKKERASRADVTEASRFAKYAIAAYGAAGFQYLHSTSKMKNTYQLLHNRGQDAYKANKLMADKITTLEQHLDYEAIIQIAEIDDQDLLYLNFDNQALGDLPYVLALDRPTKSVVVAIRGTVSVADLATDMLADPEPMEEWLPRNMKTMEDEAQIADGPRRAHAGIMAAATAVWKDLRAHRILPAMLGVSDDSSGDDSDNEQYDIAPGDGDGFEQVFGPDDKPIPGPEEQRLPYPDESPGVHHKEEPHQHRQHQRSSRRRKLHKRGSGGLPASSKGQQSSPHKEPVDVLNPVHTLNPVHMVGNLLKAGASAAQEMPNQALGRAMGAASRRHVTTPKSSEDHSHDQTTAVEDDPGYGRNQAAAVKGSAPASNHSTSNHDRHGAASDHASASPQGVATAAAATSHPANNPHDDDDDDADAKPSGWDKARHAVAEGKVKQLSSKSRGSAAKESRQLNKPSTSGGSLSKVETGPMQWMYRRGGKFAATVAKAAAAKRGVAGSSTHQRQDQQDQAGDIETGDAGLLNGSATECNRVVGSDDKPGFDAVSRHGAKDPEAAAGGQIEGRSLEHQDSTTREKYAAEIVRRGLNKEGWKLVITGHSLGAGAAALIALKLRDRYPETKCWAFCPPGGLLTPNLAHAMKPFCTSLVVNKDCIPRMSLKNLNRFMEGKLMSLACSRLNAFQIFFGSYGKVNRRTFFDKDLFRPFTDIPEEAKEMLERFQECTLTDVSAQDMVPPGRVMYLRRFKASPRAPVDKQQQHQRNARTSKYMPNSASIAGLRQLANTASSSSNDDSQSKSSLRRLKEKLPGSPPHTDGQTQRHHDVENQLNGHAAQQQGSERQAIGPQHTTGADRSSLHQQNIDGSQQRHQPVGQQPTGNAADAATAEGDSAAVAKGVPASGHQQTSGEQRHNANMQSGLLPGVGQTECSPGQSQQTEEEEHQQAGDWWSAAGLQKPPKVGEEDPDCGLSKLCSPRCLSQKRAKKKSLHKALQNPTDLFWDAVWIEPEDIIREGLLVSPKMTEDHYTTSLLRSLKAVSERLAQQEGKQGNKETQGSSQVAAADRKGKGKHEDNEGNKSGGGLKEATLGGIFDLV